MRFQSCCKAAASMAAFLPAANRRSRACSATRPSLCITHTAARPSRRSGPVQPAAAMELYQLAGEGEMIAGTAAVMFAITLVVRSCYHCLQEQPVPVLLRQSCTVGTPSPADLLLAGPRNWLCAVASGGTRGGGQDLILFCTRYSPAPPLRSNWLGGRAKGPFHHCNNLPLFQTNMCATLSAVMHRYMMCRLRRSAVTSLNSSTAPALIVGCREQAPECRPPCICPVQSCTRKSASVSK